jgi:hypothetical protein
VFVTLFEVVGMRLIPSRRVIEEFLLTYELEGCQKAVNFLTRYYGIRRMKIILDGRKVGNGDEACYDRNVAYFTKRGLNRSNVLHELYHHLACVNGWEMSERKEEMEANRYTRNVLRKTNSNSFIGSTNIYLNRDKIDRKYASNSSSHRLFVYSFALDDNSQLRYISYILGKRNQ